MTIEKNVYIINQYSKHFEWLDKILQAFNKNDIAVVTN